MSRDDSSSGTRTVGTPKSAPLRVTRGRGSSLLVLVEMLMGVVAMLVACGLLGVLLSCVEVVCVRASAWGERRVVLSLPCNFSPHSAISAADMCCDAAISACHTPLVSYIVVEQAVDSAEISALQAEISASHRMIGCNFSFSICVLIIRLRQHPLEISACCLLQRCLPSGCPACRPAGSPQARFFSRSGGPPAISARNPVVCAARRPPCDAFR